MRADDVALLLDRVAEAELSAARRRPRGRGRSRRATPRRSASRGPRAGRGFGTPGSPSPRRTRRRREGRPGGRRSARRRRRCRSTTKGVLSVHSARKASSLALGMLRAACAARASRAAGDCAHSLAVASRCTGPALATAVAVVALGRRASDNEGPPRESLGEARPAGRRPREDYGHWRTPWEDPPRTTSRFVFSRSSHHEFPCCVPQALRCDDFVATPSRVVRLTAEAAPLTVDPSAQAGRVVPGRVGSLPKDRGGPDPPWRSRHAREPPRRSGTATKFHHRLTDRGAISYLFVMFHVTYSQLRARGCTARAIESAVKSGRSNGSRPAGTSRDQPEAKTNTGVACCAPNWTGLRAS